MFDEKLFVQDIVDNKQVSQFCLCQEIYYHLTSFVSSLFSWKEVVGSLKKY